MKWVMGKPFLAKLSKTVYYTWKQEINFLQKNSIENNLLDIPKGVNS